MHLLLRMPNVVRLRQLSSRLEQLIAPDSIASSSFLCSLVTADSALPLSAFSTDPILVRHRASIADIAAACAFLKLRLAGDARVFLPYLIVHHALRVYTLAPIADVGTFLNFLSGTNVSVETCADYYLVTAQVKDIFALWRALPFVPFRGELLTGSLHWISRVEAKAPLARVLIEPKHARPLTITRKGENEIRNTGTLPGSPPKGKGSRKGKRGAIKVPPFNQANFPSFANMAS